MYMKHAQISYWRESHITQHYIITISKQYYYAKSVVIKFYGVANFGFSQEQLTYLCITEQYEVARLKDVLMFYKSKLFCLGNLHALVS